MATSSNPPGKPRKKGALRGALEDILPFERFGDERTILAGTGQSVVGLAVAIIATFATQVLITRVQGPEIFGIVTIAAEGAVVLAYFSRVGMDMAAVRRVAIEVGRGERARVRGIVARATAISLVVGLLVTAGVLFFAEDLARAVASDVWESEAISVFRLIAIAIPFAALVQVYLGATRGLKIMRHTLYVYWMGQPLGWLALILLGWAFAGGALDAATALAYSISWVLAAAAAAWFWHRETRTFARDAPPSGETGALLRYGAPRAPAALFSHLLFWTDLFVLSAFANSTETGIYAAVARAAQVILLFIIAVSLMFSPFVADLHARGERDKLDKLFKQLTRWTMALTLPLFVVLAVTPGSALRLFGSEFGQGRTALLILLLGQLVNVATGTVGFILIMVGRTGWDLLVYAGSLLFDIAAAVLLIGGLELGMEGAAIAGALTMALSKVARLWLVWRFVHIQPFDRQYARLAIPTLAAIAAGVGTHVSLVSASWPVDLLGTGAVVGLVYLVILVAVGLPPAEKRAALRLGSAALGRPR